uniref:Uncharacterized protein n=1 Tax=Rhizophora mucronata TaxID=61149 RepID=A0A2P2KUZ2_RHIMU
MILHHKKQLQNYVNCKESNKTCRRKMNGREEARMVSQLTFSTILALSISRGSG